MKPLFVHETAVVDQGAKIGEGTSVWHFSHICAQASIGRNVTLGQNVFVGNKVTIGENSKVQNNVSIYDNVSIDRDVFCGPSVVFTNVLNPRATVDRKNEFQDTVVKRGATLGANSTIVCGLEIGEYAFVGAGACVTKNVKPYALVVGVPAVQVGWMSEHGERIPLPLEGSGGYLCPDTGKEYILCGEILSVVKR